MIVQLITVLAMSEHNNNIEDRWHQPYSHNQKSEKNSLQKLTITILHKINDVIIMLYTYHPLS